MEKYICPLLDSFDIVAEDGFATSSGGGSFENPKFSYD